MSEGDPTPHARAPLDRRWTLAAIAVLFVLAWWPTLRAGWIWDDDSYVTANPAITDASRFGDIWSLTRDESSGALVSHTPQYYPLVFTSFWIEARLFGITPFHFHLVNVALHALAAFLVWRLLARLAVPGACIAAAAFALHPMHVESVAWITERKNVLSGVFALAAFLVYLRYDETRRPRFWLGAFALFVGALLSKSVTATLPIVIATALAWRHGRLEWKRLAPLVPFLVVGAFSGWFTAHLEQVKVGALGPEFDHTGVQRWFLVAPRAWWHYAAKTLVPYPIAFVYTRWDPQVGDLVAWSAPVGIVALVAVLLVLARRAGAGPLLLVFASAVTLAPALGFVPVFPHRYSWVADHFAYLGSVPLLALYAAVLVRIAPRVAPWIALLVLALFAWRTNVAARPYVDQRTLWEETLARTPTAWIAMNNLGIEIMKDPRRDASDDARALELFRSAAEYPPGRAQALTNQGNWLDVHGRAEEAAASWRAAIAADPVHRRPRELLIDLRTRQVRAAIAARRGKDALALLATARTESGDQPRFAQLEAWIRATDPDDALRDGRRARALAEALVRAQPDDAGSLDTLAVACAEAGDFDAAVAHETRAIALCGSNPACAPLRARLELFRARRPYRS